MNIMSYNEKPNIANTVYPQRERSKGFGYFKAIKFNQNLTLIRFSENSKCYSFRAYPINLDTIAVLQIIGLGYFI